MDQLQGGLEDNVLAALVTDDRLAGEIAAKVAADTFSTRTYSRLAERAIEHFRRYGRAVGVVHLRDEFEHELQRGDEGRFLATIIDAIEKIAPALQPDYVLGHLDEFIELRRLTSKVSEAADLLHAGKIEEGRNAILAAARETAPPAALIRASDIAAKPITWLWQGRIARGKITIIAGDPGLGKSQLALSIAATSTKRGRWPASEHAMLDPGDVVILSAEDDPADTIRPRLEAAGADLGRVHIMSSLVSDGAEQRSISLPRDTERVGYYLGRVSPVLFVIDPLTAFLGRTDSHRDADVRGALEPLSRLAADHGVAVVAVMHLRKGGGRAVEAVSGSLAFVAAARAAFVVTADAEDRARRLFLPAKNNIGDDRTGCAFAIEAAELGSGITTSRVVWEDTPVSRSADDALAAARAPREQAQRRAEAEAWLRELLAQPAPASWVSRQADEAGLKWATVQRAADALGVVKRRESKKDGKGGTASWVWSMPEHPGQEEHAGGQDAPTARDALLTSEEEKIIIISMI